VLLTLLTPRIYLLVFVWRSLTPRQRFSLETLSGLFSSLLESRYDSHTHVTFYKDLGIHFSDTSSAMKMVRILAMLLSTYFAAVQRFPKTTRLPSRETSNSPVLAQMPRQNKNNLKGACIRGVYSLSHDHLG
jgi:VanZ family protein